MSQAQLDTLYQQVDSALESIRPHLAVDGGNIELVEITQDFTAKVKWLGNCEFCSMSIMTMKAGVEEAIKSKVPQIQKIEAINGVN